ncbi:glutamine amidotransferase [Salaquimonas pukyongi]|uniref:glutamine amidotransferase n=1 Tax=Salaquimonas pukyongi TaxID=2712698 RepID=UPI00096BC88C|nr:glutamine amidotransferase [Salaquimonas pukyongi]
MAKQTKPFLVLQLRPETEASDNEFEAIVRKSGLPPSAFDRLRLEQNPLPGTFSLDDYAGVIVGGGPGCVSDPPEEKSPVEKRIEDTVLSLMPEITTRDFPFLGCCYGIGILAHHLGAPVAKGRYSEPVSVTTAQLEEAGSNDPLLAGLPQTFDAFVGHKESVQALPQGCAHLVSSPACPFQMIRYGKSVYATQFHPEADGDVFELRINIYRHRGYFDPQEADTLIEAAHKGNPQHAAKILRNFVVRYG